MVNLCLKFIFQVFGLIILLVFFSGCLGPSGQGSDFFGPGGGPGGCMSPDSCSEFCSKNPDVCDRYCKDNPGSCSGISGMKTGMMPMAGTACDMQSVHEKMQALIGYIVVSAPESIVPPVWMTKILPADNPYPGYYYSLSAAFGPAVEAQRGVVWSGEGEPPRTPGLDYYIVGVWDEKPKGGGATLGSETPQSLDTSKYQIAVFYTNISAPTQSAIIGSLPKLKMSEAEAKVYFYSIIKKSFINIDDRRLNRAGNMYEVRWHDSDNTQDYWDVQIGEGYIAIGQGKIYTAESMLERDPGTIWLYHACRPCLKCEEWTVENLFNKDCSGSSDCMGGLSCNGGYCVKPGADTSISDSRPALGEGMDKGINRGPGSSCSIGSDCGSGLLCSNDVCTIPER